MRKLIIGLVLASTAAFAAPASAQYANPYNYPPSHPRHPNNQGGYGYGQGQTQQISQRIERLGQRISQLYQRRAISRGEAIRLDRELNQIDRLYDRYARNGLNRNELYDVQNRLRNLQQQIREDRRDGRQGQDGRRYQDIDRGYQDDDGYHRSRRNDRIYGYDD